MRTLLLGLGCLILVTAAMVATRAADQKPEGVIAVEKAAAALAPKGWTVPRAPDGHPDLQGYYTNATLTTMERPKSANGAPFFTKESAEAFVKTIEGSRYHTKSVFLDSGSDVAITLQTSFVVDPPDGRIPEMTPAAKAALAEKARILKAKCADPTRVCPPSYDDVTPALADKPSDFTLMGRCIKWQTSGPIMQPAIYDSNYHVIQNKDYVMIQVEGGRDMRIIPLDGRPHLPSTVQQWLGDARGHWEGDTLVVDSTNFSDETEFRGLTTDRQMHLIERFSRPAPNVLLYEFTVEDPAMFTRSWTGIIPMTSIKGPIFEYACNEGNIAEGDILRGARMEEKRRAEKAAGHNEGQN
jgi:hypothetical protein